MFRLGGRTNPIPSFPSRLGKGLFQQVLGGGANGRGRTDDLRITNAIALPLSYVGLNWISFYHRHVRPPVRRRRRAMTARRVAFIDVPACLQLWMVVTCCR